jgi:two-component system, chemotaxis family, protein-glutamate methylesterase/glutaminase
MPGRDIHVIGSFAGGVETLSRLVSGVPADLPAALGVEAGIAELDPEALDPSERPGAPSPYSCPDCGGVLWELQDGQLLRYRCRVGHAWTAETLLDRQSDGLEAALWTALRALEEKIAQSRRLAERVRRHGFSSQAAAHFERQAAESEGQAALLRRTLLSRKADEPPPGEGYYGPSDPAADPTGR